MTFLESLKYYVQKSTILLCYIGMALLIPMMLLTTGEVLGRAVWNKPIPGTLELSSYMLAVFILLGLAYTQQVKGHVRVEMLIKRLPERVGLVLNQFCRMPSGSFSRGIRSQPVTYRRMPSPLAKQSRANAVRISHTGTPNRRLRPAATPANQRPSSGL